MTQVINYRVAVNQGSEIYSHYEFCGEDLAFAKAQFNSIKNELAAADTIELQQEVNYSGDWKAAYMGGAIVNIQDELTGEFYCVPEIIEDNTFPFWSKNQNQAHNFGSVLLAEHELNMNDLTCDETRKPIVIA